MHSWGDNLSLTGHVHPSAHMRHTYSYAAHSQGYSNYAIIFLRREGRESGVVVCESSVYL